MFGIEITPWLVVGFAGQACFFARFVVQWFATEKAKRVVVPRAFWWLSIAGSLVLLCYSIHLENPVFILAFTPNVFIYSRNLYFSKLEEARLEGLQGSVCEHCLQVIEVPSEEPSKALLGVADIAQSLPQDVPSESVRAS